MRATKRRSDQATQGTESPSTATYVHCAAFPLRRSVAPSLRRFRLGYSFTEVMFAVIVLGIGFIMVAAIFPVAIQQTQATSEEATAALLARGAVDQVEKNIVSLTTLLPPSGDASYPNRPKVFSFRNPQALAADNFATEDLWNRIKGTVINGEDARYGFVALYRRAGNPGDPTTWSSSAQLYILVTESRNRSQFTLADDLTVGTAADPVNLQAKPVTVDIKNNGVSGTATAGAGTDFVAITGGEVEAVAEGSFLVVAVDGLPGLAAGTVNGAIYRIGARRADLDSAYGGNPVYELQVGSDFDAISAGVNELPAAEGFVLGKTRDDATDTYSGAAQDVAIYTTFIQVRP